MSADAALSPLVPTVPAWRRHAVALSAGLHLATAMAILWFPALPPRDLGKGAFTIELVAAPPPEPQQPPPESPKPEAPKPEPPKPEPPKPELAKPQLAKPEPPKASPPAKAPPRPAPATPAAQPAPAQPVMTEGAAESPPATTATTDSAAPAASVPVPAPAARGAERDDYLRMVWARIMRFRPERVPFAGLARLRFTLGADGSLTAVEIAESSGSGLLDRAALDAVRRAAPFPAPPGLSESELTFEIPFQFRRAG